MPVRRPNCELCDCDLPLQSAVARICAYECTYCVGCVETVPHNVCPSCGGGFSPQLVRPRIAWRNEKRLWLSHNPAIAIRHQMPYTLDDIKVHVTGIKHLLPLNR